MNYWIDIDDTICNTDVVIMKAALHYHEGVLKRQVPCDDAKENFSTDYFYFARYLGWDVEDVSRFFHDEYPCFLRHALIKKDVKKSFDYLRQNGHKITLLSARYDREYNGETLNITRQWLKDNKIVADDIILDCANKSAFLSDKEGVFIDDSYNDCMELSLNQNIRVIQFLSMYSKQCDSPYVTVVTSWEQIHKLKYF